MDNISFSNLIDLGLFLTELANFVYKICKDKKKAAYYNRGQSATSIEYLAWAWVNAPYTSHT